MTHDQKEELYRRVWNQLDNNWPVDAVDIRRLMNIVKEPKWTIIEPIRETSWTKYGIGYLCVVATLVLIISIYAL